MARSASPQPPMDRRTRLLTAPIWPTLTRMAVPGIAAMAIQSSMSIVETWYLGRAGTVELAGVALVFPILMLANMLSGGAVGGAISGATANALGANDQPRAEMILRSSVILALGCGITMAVLFLIFGEAFYRFLGGQGAVLQAALTYSNLLMPGLLLIWLTNMSAGVLRGGGDMLRPAIVQTITAVTHFALCWILIEQQGLGMAGAALAMDGGYAVGLLSLWVMILSGRSHVLFRWGPVSRALMVPLLRVGGLAGFQAIMTVVTALTITGLVGRLGPAWLAGYGIGARLEFLMIPIIFGIGSALIAMVGTNAGAGQRDRAIGIAWRGAFAAGVIVGSIGLFNAAFPTAWAGLFTTDPAVQAATAAYMGTVAPCYVFFGFGLALYFACQAMQTLAAPVFGSLTRLGIVMIGGLSLFATDTVDPAVLFGLVGTAMTAYGLIVASALRFRSWRPALASSSLT